MTSRYPEREKDVHERFKRLSPTLDERGRRLFAANEAVQFTYGGVAAVQRATGVARSTIKRGINELEDLETLAPAAGKLRHAGAGRKPLEELNPGIVNALDSLVAPATRGDPQSPLLWTSKSLRQLARALTTQGHKVGPDKVRRMLLKRGFTLQGTRKVLEGASHPDRNEQFEFINSEIVRFQKEGQPVISIDTKKKELVGTYANAGRDWHEKGKGPRVDTYDFPNGKPKAVPYGVYDLARNEGWVTVGTSSDTAEFAANSIIRWWEEMGKAAYPEATDLMVTADGGGSNGS